MTFEYDSSFDLDAEVNPAAICRANDHVFVGGFNDPTNIKAYNLDHSRSPDDDWSVTVEAGNSVVPAGRAINGVRGMTFDDATQKFFLVIDVSSGVHRIERWSIDHVLEASVLLTSRLDAITIFNGVLYAIELVNVLKSLSPTTLAVISTVVENLSTTFTPSDTTGRYIGLTHNATHLLMTEDFPSSEVRAISTSGVPDATQNFDLSVSTSSTSHGIEQIKVYEIWVINNNTDAIDIYINSDLQPTHFEISVSDTISQVTDTITSAKSIAVSDDITGTTDSIATDKNISLSDNIAVVTDTIEKRLGREITDTVTGVTDTIQATTVSDNRSLSDTIPAVTDTLSKSRGYLRTVDDSIAESLGEPILLGSNTLSDIRGMTFWEDENLIISSFFLGSTSNIILIQYNPTTHEFTITSTSAQSVSNRISGLAFIQSESKLLAATTNDISHMNAVPNNTTGATISGLDALTVTGIETPIQSLTYHPASGRVLIGVAGNTRKIFDFLYNASDGTLTDKRELAGNYTAGNPRSLAMHGDVLVISDTLPETDEINAYDYDSVAATLNNGRKLRDEPSINASTFAGDQYVLIRPDGGIYRHQYVAPFFR